MTAAQRAKVRLDAAYKAGTDNAKVPFGSARRKPGFWQDGEIGRNFATAYDLWMKARAAAGDRWVLSLRNPSWT